VEARAALAPGRLHRGTNAALCPHGPLWHLPTARAAQPWHPIEPGEVCTISFDLGGILDADNSSSHCRNRVEGVPLG